MLRRRVVASGRVQGVFYRDSCQRQARRHQVRGWVANRPDGTVEAVFEGEASDVEAMVAWCRTGPPRAEVTHLEVTDEPPGDESAFRVLTGAR